jgi:catechol 2,3-dioxygenase-like lactoylglutathione lyase family enzyme
MATTATPTYPTSAAPALTGLGAITIFVRDLDRARTFYGEVFGLKQIFADEVSTVFDLGNTMINLLEEGEAPGLIGPAKVAAVEDGARTQLTIFVEDTDAVIAMLVARGGTVLNGPFDRPWGVRTACFADPDGTIWEIAQQV